MRLPGQRGPHPPHPVGTVRAARNPLGVPPARQARRQVGVDVRQAAQAGRSGGGSGVAGLTSSVGAEAFRFPAAAGRRGIPRRSISWSCTETTALAAAMRSGAGAAPSQARSPRSAAILRRRRTIWAGSVALETARIVPVLPSLARRLFGVISGVAVSRLGMTPQCSTEPLFSRVS